MLSAVKLTPYQQEIVRLIKFGSTVEAKRHEGPTKTFWMGRVPKLGGGYSFLRSRSVSILFENKIIVASCLGVANAALLAVGILGTRFSPYQTASKALTLLACLVMPLNLWFYDAQGLITLDQGGHLWVPALVCCAIYVWVTC